MFYNYVLSTIAISVIFSLFTLMARKLGGIMKSVSSHQTSLHLLLKLATFVILRMMIRRESNLKLKNQRVWWCQSQCLVILRKGLWTLKLCLMFWHSKTTLSSAARVTRYLVPIVPLKYAKYLLIDLLYIDYCLTLEK